MRAAKETFAAVALTKEGLLLVTDTRRRMNDAVCDGVEKIQLLDAGSGAFVVAGLECAADSLDAPSEDPCADFERAVKPYDLRRVVRSVIRNDPLSVAKVVELGRGMVAEAAALDPVMVQGSHEASSWHRRRDFRSERSSGYARLIGFGGR